MSGPIHLYVSSSSELVGERETVAQIVAALPVGLGWRISHTPLSGPLDALVGMDALDALLQSCDLYALVLGQDLSAPMGFEVRSELARRKRASSGYPGGVRLVGAYRKECTRSPSAQDAIRNLELAWQPYSTLEAFGAHLKRDLLKALLEVGPELGLDLADVARLLRDQRTKEEGAQATEEEAGTGHAGRSGRILGREVWQPREQGQDDDANNSSPA
jgi:hypothetical protein